MFIVTGRICAAATTVLLGLLALAPTAWGLAEPVAGGSASISMNRGLYQLLKLEGVRVAALTPGTVEGRLTTLPVAPGGAFDPTTGKGSVGLEGGVEFKAGKRRVALSGLVLDTTRHTLTGKVGARTLLIASTIGLKETREGFGAKVAVKSLKLRGTAAKILNRKLGLDGVFRRGRSFAEASSSTQPASVPIAGGSAVLVGDEETFAKLKALDVALTPFESARVLGTNPPTFSFPLLPSGAAVPLDLSSGGVGSETGLRLIQQGGPPPAELSVVGLSASLEAKIISADTSVQSPSAGPSRFGVTPIATLDTGSASRSIDPSTRTITLANAAAKINQFLAERLNDAFAKPPGKGPTFTAGEPLGTVAITVQAP